MDRHIAALEGVVDGDLMLCSGVAYQRDMSTIVAYDEAYYDKCAGYEGLPIANKINRGRIAFVAKHYSGRVLDIGIGSGEFIKLRPNTYGFDVNPVAIEWLKRNDLWVERFDWFSAFTFWDSVEHCKDPEEYLREIPLHGFAFFSIPIFADVSRIRESRHYRPNEHLYYWTAPGFVEWLQRHGFLLLDHQDFETAAGRDNVHSFAFKRIAWR